MNKATKRIEETISKIMTRHLTGVTLSCRVNPALERQVGGNHYKSMAIQPAEFCLANMSIEEIRGAMRWNILKYISRNKNGIEDLEKAKHYIEIWIQAEKEKASKS